MKKFLIPLLVCLSVVGFSQSSDSQLNTQANQIKNETVAGQNTANRIGQMFLDIIASKVNNSNLTWANVLSKPTTLSGFGITDGVNTSLTITVNGESHNLSSNPTFTVDKTDVGLGNADNTSDANKPVSTPTQTALDGKVSTTVTVNGHALSSNVTVTAADVGAATPADLDALETSLLTAMETTNKVLITGAITLDETDFGKWHVCSGTSVDYTITLPTAVGNEGKMILFKGDNSTANLNKLVTIDGAGTETINNSLTYAITTRGYLTIIARVTAGVGSWDIIGFDQGLFYTWTPVYTGFSVNPTGYAAFKRGIGVVDLIISQAAGTGSLTTVTVDLPLGLVASGEQRFAIPYLVNNNVVATVQGLIVTATGDDTLFCYPNQATGAWAGSNLRYIKGTWRVSVE